MKSLHKNKVADVAIVAGIGRPILVFSFAALKVFNTSNVLHLRLIHARVSLSSVCDLVKLENFYILMRRKIAINLILSD